MPKFQTLERSERRETPHSKIHSHLQRSMGVKGPCAFVASLNGRLSVLDSRTSEFKHIVEKDWWPVHGAEDVDKTIHSEGISEAAEQVEDDDTPDLVVVDELQLWPFNHLVVVGGPKGLHFFRQGGDLRRLGCNLEQGANKHLSTFGPYLAFQMDKDISIATASVQEDFVNLRIGIEFNLEGKATMWQLWERTLMVIFRSGEIAVYSTEGNQRLLAKTDPNVLVMYQSPCFIFRLSLNNIKILV